MSDDPLLQARARVIRARQSLERKWDEFDTTPEAYYGEKKTTDLMLRTVGIMSMRYNETLEAYVAVLESRLHLDPLPVPERLSEDEIAQRTRQRAIQIELVRLFKAGWSPYQNRFQAIENQLVQTFGGSHTEHRERIEAYLASIQYIEDDDLQDYRQSALPKE